MSTSIWNQRYFLNGKISRDIPYEDKLFMLEPLTINAFTPLHSGLLVQAFTFPKKEQSAIRAQRRITVS